MKEKNIRTVESDNGEQAGGRRRREQHDRLIPLLIRVFLGMPLESELDQQGSHTKQKEEGAKERRRRW